MKKFVVMLIMLLFLTVTSSIIFADKLDIYTTDALGNTTPVTVFGWDNTPYLYIHLPESGLNSTAAWWESPGSSYYLTGNMGFDQDIWLSLNNGVDAYGNPVDWFDVRELGMWNITAGYLYADGDPTSMWDTTSFTVTPEPISSILFVTGGATLLLARRNRNRKKRLLKDF